MGRSEAPMLARAQLPLVAASTALAALACAGGPAGSGPAYHVPTLAEQSDEGDGALDLVDRTAALAGSLEAADASGGPALDLAGAPPGFAMAVDSRGMNDTSGLASGSYADAPAGPATQFNLFHAAAMVTVADAHTALLIGVPAAAAAIALDGTTTEITTNVWASSNTVSDGTTSVTGLFVVAWVEVGWLAEMRLWSSDGRYEGNLWYRGFLSRDGDLGWWDFYDESRRLAGVIEWTDDGQGNSQLGLAATNGPEAGDVLLYLFEGGTGFVGYHDEDVDQDYSVFGAADHSGELVDPAYNGGAPACWDAGGNDAPCP